MTDKKVNKLPQLIDLPVYQEVYCSQQMTDEILKRLWKQNPDLVVKQLELEQEGEFDQTYLMQVAHIADFFRKEMENYNVPHSGLGLLDLLFEMSRRLKKVKNLSDMTVIGKPLCVSLHGVFPKLPNLPVRFVEGQPRGKYVNWLTQEVADRIIQGAYKERPDLFFEFAENLRRFGIWPWSSANQLRKLFGSIAKPEDEVDSSRENEFLGETVIRLRKICEL